MRNYFLNTILFFVCFQGLSQVGIGTLTPTKSLDINGELRIQTLPISSDPLNASWTLTADNDGNITKVNRKNPTSILLEASPDYTGYKWNTNTVSCDPAYLSNWNTSYNITTNTGISFTTTKANQLVEVSSYIPYRILESCSVATLAYDANTRVVASKINITGPSSFSKTVAASTQYFSGGMINQTENYYINLSGSVVLPTIGTYTFLINVATRNIAGTDASNNSLFRVNFVKSEILAPSALTITTLN
ncbi:hypothetical protein ABF179_001320 [Flavobacterium psychrophilum]|uniref:hypothetical protein n=1 Tax=Flavobacterium psychrophilum TaxID=96345 RepID=UPI000A377878|nr:hypothetical protein [Flavobacterium psychrophilum]EKT4518503.1 hypothetical protein [Flavobacterium psychrophilum]EKT4550163.1 hypothetical protein [Flavobacterium psychrophilum]ELI6453857.1 hypothetical protein [Flavobacterium psychrophilum]ELM3644137.1 hypothetical protein [Flavobacterium psychrophilum]MCB6061802.1 hypothetical protein [Flavobacterium psychrophilum]